MIVGAVFLMTLADALVKLVSADFSLWQLYVTRGMIAIPILIGIMRWRGMAIWPTAPGWAYLRASLLVLMWIVYYAALPVLSLSVAAVALYTSPLLIALLSARLIGEPVGVRRWIAIAIGFVGVIAILRPGAESFSWFTLLPILGAAFYASAMILTRSRCLNETPLTLALALNVSLMLSGVVATGVLAMLNLAPEQSSVYPFVLGSWTGMGLRDWAMVALLGALIAVYSACVAKAYQVASPSIVATFDYAYLVFAAVWGFVLFADAPAAGTVIGMILITVAGVLVTTQSSGAHEATSASASVAERP
jgi:drug/metabolite transporter (DMT)-like permease